MLPTGRGSDEGGYRIEDEVRHILAGIEFDEMHAPVDEIQVPLAEPPHVTMRRLCSMLVNTHGKAWRKCTIERHCMPDGSIVFTASRMCPFCSSQVGSPVTHTYIAMPRPDGGFDFAAPLEDE